MVLFKSNIETLLEVCSRYARNLGEKRTVTFEYTLINQVNDRAEHARQLSRLLRGFPCKINLIPFNPFPGTDYQRPTMTVVRAFQDQLVKDGYSVTVRATRGDDIQAACGQLVGQVAVKTRRQAKYKRIQTGEVS